MRNQNNKRSKPETRKPAQTEVETPVAKIPEDVIEWASRKRDKLISEAKADPSTDAGQIIQVLLLNAIINDTAKIPEMTLSKMLEEQRRYKELEAKTTKWKLDLKYAEQRIKLAKLKLREAKQKMTVAEKNHQPGGVVDFEGILSTISAAIGVGEPLAPRVEATA